MGISVAISGTAYAITVFNSSQVGSNPHNGYILQTNGTVSTWVVNSGGSPASPNTSVQFNNGGNFGGSANFTWDGTTLSATAVTSATINNTNFNGQSIQGSNINGLSIYGSQDTSKSVNVMGNSGDATSFASLDTNLLTTTKTFQFPNVAGTFCIVGVLCDGTGSATPAFTVTSYGGSTTTTLGLLGGFFSTASSTFSNNLFLSSIGQGILISGTNGIVKSVATSTFSLSQFTNDLASLSATNASLTFTGSYNGSAARTVGLNVGNTNTWTVVQNFNYASVTSYLSSQVASSTQLNIGTGQGWLYTGTNGQVFAISSSSSGFVPTTRAITINGTASQITSSAGSQDLSADRTWTLSFPNQVVFPQYASTTNGFSTPYSSSTEEHIGLAQGFAYIGSNTKVNSVASSSINLADFNNNLANLTALDTSLTFSGSYNGSAARTVGLNVGRTNTWTVLQNFNYSSSTIYSSFITASSTNYLGGGLTTCTGSNFLQYTSANFFACVAGNAGTVTSVVAGAGFQNQGLNITSSGTLVGAIATTATPVLGNIPFYTRVGDASNPTGIGTVGTSSIASGVGITVTNGATAFVIGAQPSVACNTASVSVFGCLNASDFSKFNSATTTFSAPLVYTQGTNAVTCPTCMTSYDAFTHLLFGAQQSGSFAATTSMMAIGTSSAASSVSALTVASSTASQLALSDGASGDVSWTMRNAGTTFYLGTTTVAGTATTSKAFLSITNAGAMNIATSTGGCLQTNANGDVFVGSCTSVTGLSFGKSWEVDTLGQLAPTTTLAVSIPTWLSINDQTFAYSSTTNGVTILGLKAGGNTATTSTTLVSETAIGMNTLAVNGTGGLRNTAVGYNSLIANTTGDDNIALGSGVLNAMISGARNIGIGSSALLNTTGNENVAVGNGAGQNITGGSFNAYLGVNTANANTCNCSGQTLIGDSAGQNVTTGASNNTLIGFETGANITTGSENTIIGGNAVDGGTITTGNGNIGLGSYIYYPSATINRQLNIGNAIWGNLSATTTTFGGISLTSRIGIGTTTPQWTLDLASSTMPQLALSDGSLTSSHWVFRNSNSNLYIGTADPTTFATSSTAAITWLSTGAEGINDTTPDFRLEAVGSLVNGYFGLTQTTDGDIFNVSSNGNVGIGSTTPWGALSISSSTPSYTNPLFSVSTSTTIFSSLFNIFATTTSLINTIGIADSGARVAIGTTTEQGYPGLLDQLYVPGRINTGDWRYIECTGLSGVISSIGGDTANACGQFQFQVDAAGALNVLGLSNGLMINQIQDSAGTANNGAGLFLANLSQGFTIATSTPVMEVVGRINTPGNNAGSYFNIGLTNQSIGGSNFELEPTAGCYFVASSSIPAGTGQTNWQAQCRTSLANTTTVDTGFASTTSLTTTGAFSKFRIEIDNNTARFYIATSTKGYAIVANITTNIPKTVIVIPGVYISNISTGSSKFFDVNDIKFWWNQPVFNYSL